MMDRLYFPITKDPTDAEHRSKFSYFLEFREERTHPEHRERCRICPNASPAGSVTGGSTPA